DTEGRVRKTLEERESPWDESSGMFFLVCFPAAGSAHDGAHREFLPQPDFDVARLDTGSHSCMSRRERLPRGATRNCSRSLNGHEICCDQFPGSNCDQDCVAAINGLEGLRAEYVWHQETSVEDFNAIVLPGGFAYGDYLRCGAIARFSPIMKAVISDARAGKLVLGTCNGFQVLCEAGLLPGALVRNRSLRFVCDMVTTRVEVDDSPFTHGCPK